MVAFDSSYFKTCKTTPNSVPIIAKDIAIVRLSVIGGGHLQFSHEKVGEENGNSLFSVLLGQYK